SFDRRRPGVDHGGRLDHPEARGVREMAHRLFVGLRHHPVRHGVRTCQHLREGSQPGEAEMSRSTAAHSVVEPSTRTKAIALVVVGLYAAITMVPLLWIGLTSLKSPDDSISYPPKMLFSPSLEGYCNLFTTRSRQTADYIQSLGPPTGVCDEIARSKSMVIVGPSNYAPRFVNSLIIAFGSTFLAVTLGTLAAYGFSRFKGALKDD